MEKRRAELLRRTSTIGQVTSPGNIAMTRRNIICSYSGELTFRSAVAHCGICDTTNRMIAESRHCVTINIRLWHAHRRFQLSCTTPFTERQLSNWMNRRTQAHSICGSSSRHGLSAGSAGGNWAVFWSPGRGRLRPRIQKHSGTSDHSERFPVGGGSTRLVGQLDTGGKTFKRLL